MAGLTFPKFPKSTIWGFCELSRNSHTPYRRGGKKSGEFFGGCLTDLFGLEQQTLQPEQALFLERIRCAAFAQLDNPTKKANP